MTGATNRLRDLARRYAGMPPEKRALLRSRLADRGVDFRVLPIPPQEEGAPLPASHAQQRLWVLWQLDPESPAYNLSAALRLKGALDLPAVQGAIDAIVERHEPLRTVFEAQGEALLQVVRPPSPVDIQYSEATEETIDDLVQKAIIEPFDLAEGPLLRVTIYRLGPDRHVLLLRLHHIISDGWSLNLLIGEFGQLYRAKAVGETVDLPPLPITYGAYARWQRMALEAGGDERDLTYWRETLGTEDVPLSLPAKGPRPKERSPAGDSVVCCLDAGLADALRRLASAANATLYMVVLAAFSLMLARICGQTDIRIAMPVANRTRREVEGLIGLFVNTLVLRLDIDGRQSFGDFLTAVRQTCLHAQDHQELPFEQVVSALAPERDLERHPLFQVMFNHQRIETAPISALPGLEAEPLSPPQQVAKVDLSLDTLELEDGSLQVGFTFATDLLAKDECHRLLERLAGLLRQVPGNLQRALNDFDIFIADEKPRLAAWNATSGPLDETSTLTERFVAQVKRTPGAPALIFGERVLDYAALDRLSDIWAAKLRSLGIGPDHLVAIAAERSIEMVVGLLAIEKAGGAYVPLDPDLPADRLSFMLGDCGAEVVLTQSHLLESLPATDARVVVLDGDEGGTAGAVDFHLTPQHPLSLAYCIYTSGTTGRPKGAGNSHRAVLNRLDWMQRAYEIGAGDRVLQKTPFSFDVSGWEFFWPLLNGATLVMAPPRAHQNPVQLQDLITRHRITVVHFVPSMLQAFLGVADIGACESLRHVICSGEALPRDVQQRFLAASQAELHNLYGPTEAAIDVTFWCCDSRDSREAVPIGRPIANLQLHVLDADMNEVPPGVTGELYIGGIGLARGYHRRPALTAERFHASPFGRGERLYRTGDLARWSQDGVLEYLGRTDHQVKIRGQRVELGEIEARLLEHEGVREAVVVARSGPGGAQQLCGYVVAPPGARLETALKAHVRQHLPDYMVPSAIVCLEAMPLSPNGKLDRRALPEPMVTPGSGWVPPEGAGEKRLAEIWQNLLGVERIGATDNFFELGGDSIIAIQLVSRARQHGLKFSPRDVFGSQTVRELARAAAGITGAEVPQGPVTGECRLTPLQTRFFATSLPRPHHWNQAVLLQPKAALDTEALRQALAAVVRHHDALRLRFAQDRAWHAEIDQATAQELLWIEEVRGAKQMRRLSERVQGSLDLAEGPLLRAALMRLADGTSRLLLVIHHLVVDGLSWRVLLEDLDRAYHQVAVGGTVELPAKTEAFAAWTRRLHESVYSDDLLAQRHWWIAHLDGAEAGLLPDTPGPGGRGADSAKLAWRLGSEETRQLLQESPKAYRTRINDILLTAMARALCRHSGSPEALIELESHGREGLETAVDLSRTVGWFTATYPVRLVPGTDPGGSLQAIKEQLRAVPQNGLGYGLLREIIRHPDLERTPRPRVAFNYLGQFDSSFGEAALFQPAEENGGSSIDPEAPLGTWLSVDGGVAGERLKLTWTYDATLFERPTIERLVELFDAELKILLAHCLDPAEGGLSPSDFPLAELTQAQLDKLPVAPRQVEDIYPLTPLQQGILFHGLYEEGSTSYINQLEVTVEGLEAERFCAAWQATIDQYESLRCGFHWREGGSLPLQVVYRQVSCPPRIMDFRREADLAGTLSELAERERSQPFDLQAPPLMRLVLARLDDSRYRIVWTYHHILLDGWSSAQFMGEMLRRYEGSPVAPPGGRYRDYIAWLNTRAPEEDREFWAGQLQRLEEPTILSSCLGDEGNDRGHGIHTAVLDQSEVVRLQNFARQRKVTLNALVQAAWLILLQRYAGQPSVVFGATMAGRPADLPGAERQVGLFINTVPVVGTPRPDLTVAEWLDQVQSITLALREHEHTPLVDIQRWFGQAGHALFDTVLVFENYPVAEAFQKTTLRARDTVSHEQAHYGLVVEVSAGDCLRIHYRHDRGAFTEAAIERLDRHFRHVIGSLAEDSQRLLADISLLEETERDKLLGMGMSPETTLPAPPLLVDMFQQTLSASPEAVAVIAGDRQLSYGELAADADRLASRLRAAGVGPDRLVGVAMERTADMVIALLAVLKAGGAYLPLDLDFPADRLDYMLKDSGVSLVLSDRAASARLPKGAEALEVWYLEGDESPGGSGREGQGRPALSSAPQADHLAYVIYTSGSTGRPKGVEVTQRALVNFLASMAREPGLRAGDRMLALTSLSFDIAGLELFLPLVAGGTVVLADREMARDPAQLWAAIERHAVTAIQATPSTWRMLAEGGEVTDLAGRKVLCGGEALSEDLARLLAVHAGEAWNLFGPTETTIWSAAKRLDREDPQPWLGDPISCTALYILDDTLNPVPPGGFGELFIGGAGLARGYHRRPDLTGERFLPDPFAGNGARMYRTGDLARRLPNGELAYGGRVDQQVKIRGFRIELGEIEAVLLGAPGIAAAAVVDRPSPGGAQLVGYVVAKESSDDLALEASLKERLRASLPDYMIPARILRLDAMPMTPNRKLDRKALPAPEWQGRDYAPPTTDAERALVQVWQNVIGLEQVGIDDRFFELGGDSIVAIQVLSQYQQLGWSITPRQIFELQTVRALAAAAEPMEGRAAYRRSARPLVALSDAQWAELPVSRDAVEDIYPLSPLQEGLLMHTLLEPGSGIYLMQNRHSIEAEVDHGCFDAAWARVVERNEALRASFLWDGLDKPLQYISADAGEYLFHFDLRGLDDTAQRAEIDAVMQDELDRGMDMSRPPLFCIRLFRLGEDRYELVVSYHHVIMDAWCVFLLLSDFVVFYRALKAGSEPKLPPQPAYRDFIAWLQGRDLTRIRAYWRETLAGFDAATPIPSDRPIRPGPEPSRIIDRIVTLNAEEDEALRRLATKQEITLNTFVQAAWALVLHAYSGSRDVAFGITVAGRPLDVPELQRTLGLFINTVPLRVTFPAPAETTRVGDWLKALMDQNLAMREFEHLPLVEIHGLSDIPQGLPLFDTLFVFENAPIDRVVLQDAEEMRAAVTESRTHTNYPITAVAYPRDRLSLHLSCDRRFFDPATVERLLSVFKESLMALVRHFDLPMRDLAKVDGREHRRLLEAAGPAPQPYPFERGYAALFEEAVAAHSERPAVSCLGDSITYEALNRRSNAVAWCLIDRGVGPDDLVVIAGDRNIDLLTSILGTLKAGAGYLAVDSSQPVDRLADVIADAAPAAILCQDGADRTLAEVRREGPSALASVPFVTSRALSEGDWPDHNPGLSVGARHLAYVIYTSGSTGRPKGVMVEQAGMLNNQLSKIPVLGLTPSDAIAQTANQGFDISVWQFLTALLCGARVDIVPDEIAHDPAGLLRHVARAGITVLESVPSLIQGMLEEEAVELAALRWVLPTGEALTPGIARNWFLRYPDVPLVNAYGPAECSDDVALQRIDRAPDDRAFMPVGTATDNNRLYVLDDQLALVPVGAIGELYVAGTGVGRGYLRRPGQTGCAFVPDPYAKDPGGRLYRTGDLVRWNAAGQIEFVGRADHQVKIRGFRIELGEIEARLDRMPELREVVVSVRDTPVGRQLVCHAAAAAPAASSGELLQAVKSGLKQQLPDYMIPTQWMLLDSLPRNANGKVDRAALPDPEWESQAYVAPRSDLERQLANIWADVLRVERVGVTDDFFQMGGHSLLVTQIFSRVRRDLQVPLTLRQVFEVTTVAELAVLIEKSRGTALTEQKAKQLDDLMHQLESL